MGLSDLLRSSAPGESATLLDGISILQPRSRISSSVFISLVIEVDEISPGKSGRNTLGRDMPSSVGRNRLPNCGVSKSDKEEFQWY
ncbi:hypothetical protein [Algoriphagus boritolerans]|uniref:hypothetical protein n=1 Tax=Algoriphagus boritolerans TaxID=308111 RepID=UPI002FCDFD65